MRGYFESCGQLPRKIEGQRSRWTLRSFRILLFLVNWRQPLRNLLGQGRVETGNKIAINVLIFLETAPEVGVRRERGNNALEAKLASIIAPAGHDLSGGTTYLLVVI